MNSFSVEINSRPAVVILKEGDIEIRDDTNQLIMDLVDQSTIAGLRKRADEFRERLRRFPPGVKFYAYDQPHSQMFKRSTVLPTVKELDADGAGPITAELIAHMLSSPTLGNFKLVGIYHEGRVVAFEYIYQNDKLHHYQYHQ